MMVGISKICRFLQSNRDRRQIFAVVTGDGPAVAFGSLALNQIYAGLYTEPYPTRWHPRGDEALAVDLAARAGDFHDLDDFYRFHGYSAELIDWVEATPLNIPTEGMGGDMDGGREESEVVERFGLDRERLVDAAFREGIVPGAFDPAGDPLYHVMFDANWAVVDPSGHVRINPKAYRFKAWLSLEN